MIYKTKKYYRWLIEFGVFGLWQLIRCRPARYGTTVCIRSKRYGSLTCRKCPEDFEAVNTIMCFGAYTVGREQFGCVLDLGANIGIATRYFLTALPGIPIVAIEPFEDNCRLFEENMQASNGLVELLQCAVGPTDGVGQFRGIDGVKFDSLKVSYAANQPEEQTVSIRSMQRVTKQLAQPILLKMDVEGAENSLLVCRADWIAKVSKMMIEFHDPREESYWLSVLASEGWTSKKYFDTWHFSRVPDHRGMANT